MRWLDRCHSLSLNGPVPTGMASAGFFRESVPAHTCLGRMPTAEMPGIIRTLGPSNRRITVCLSGVSTAFRFAT